MLIINGKKIAEEIIAELKKQPKPKKFLAAFFVAAQNGRASPDAIRRGDDAASISFLKQKEAVAKELGIDFRVYKFSEDIKQDSLRKEILKIVSHKNCGGAIVQLPLPEHINKHYILNVIPREKDIDVLSERALGAFYAGRPARPSGGNPVLPPSVGVVEKILLTTNYQLLNTKVAVIGLGFLVGKPIANWLMGKAKEIYLLDEGSDLSPPAGGLKEADLVISGVGKANLFNSKDLKENALVIDFGYSFENGKISGDFNSLQTTNYSLPTISYTPTPGGTGPILVAKLFENFFRLNAE